MAKKLPPVKCKFCGHVFDRDKVEYVAVKNRYAHKECYDKYQAQMDKEAADSEKLNQYILTLFNYKTMPEKVKKQIKTYVTENGYSYSGILKSLIYHYEIKHGDIEKANGGIGIVPWVYETAKQYYYNIWLAQQQNRDIEVEQYVRPQVEIRIKTPDRKPMGRRRKLFTFLNEEEEE